MFDFHLPILRGIITCFLEFENVSLLGMSKKHDSSPNQKIL